MRRKNMTRLRRVPTFLSAAALTTALAGCGGSSTTPTPTSTPTPTPPPPQVVFQVTGFSVPAGFAAGGSFTTSRAGALDATVDWTFATNDIDVFIGQGSCDENTFGTSQCPILAAAQSATAKPETIHLASAAAGTYTIVVANFGATDESASLQVVLTASATGIAPVTATRRSGEAASVQLKQPPRGWVELR
jgi:hypothetical protein